jgi:hypothetical protein
MLEKHKLHHRFQAITSEAWFFCQRRFGLRINANEKDNVRQIYERRACRFEQFH